METEVEGIQTRCFSRCFAAINEMKIVIVTIYNFQEQQKTNFLPPFPVYLPVGEGRGRIDTRNPCTIFHDEWTRNFSPPSSIVSQANVWTCPRKITGRHNCGNQGEGGRDFTDNGTRSDNYLPRTRFRIPWI